MKMIKPSLNLVLEETWHHFWRAEVRFYPRMKVVSALKKILSVFSKSPSSIPSWEVPWECWWSNQLNEGPSSATAPDSICFDIKSFWQLWERLNQEIIRNRTWRMFISNYFTVFSNRTMSNFACKSSYTEMNLAYSFNCFNFLWSLCTFFSSKSIFLLTVCKERLAITQNEHTVLLGAWRGSLSFDFKGPPDRTSFISPSIIPSFSCFLSPLLDSYNSKVVL